MMQETGEMEREKICVRAELFGGDAYYCTRGRVWEESKYDVGEIVDTRSIACGPPHMTRWHDDLRSNCFKQKRMARSISTKTTSYREDVPSRVSSSDVRSSADCFAGSELEITSAQYTGFRLLVVGGLAGSHPARRLIRQTQIRRY